MFSSAGVREKEGNGWPWQEGCFFRAVDWASRAAAQAAPWGARTPFYAFLSHTSLLTNILRTRRNTPSIDFYVSDTVGAQLMDGWVGCRVDGEKLGKLAEQR